MINFFVAIEKYLILILLRHTGFFLLKQLSTIKYLRISIAELKIKLIVTIVFKQVNAIKYNVIIKNYCFNITLLRFQRRLLCYFYRLYALNFLVHC